MTYLVLVMVVVCVAAVWLWQHRKKTKQAAQVADIIESNKYHCVTITCRDNPCEAVKRLEGKRFLSVEAPALPLHGCAEDVCRCHYVHYYDRRDDDRRHPYGRYRSTPPTSIGPERRIKTGRRSNDLVDLDEHPVPDHVSTRDRTS